MIKKIKNKLIACWYILTHDRYYLFCTKKRLSVIKDNELKVMLNNPVVLVDQTIIEYLLKK